MQRMEIGTGQAGQRLDKYLHRLMPTAGTGFLYKMLRKKNITLNGKKAEGNELLQCGDTVCFFFSEETFRHFTGAALEDAVGAVLAYERAYRNLRGIQVCYEDDHILILNKPAGILTQRARPDEDSLNEWMIGYLLDSGKTDAASLTGFRPSVQNRLDRNTSGLVICGISLEGSRKLSALIRERTLRKFYLTIVKGRVSTAGILKGTLTKDTLRNKVSLSASEDGSPVRTAYRPLAYSRSATLLEVELITGKTHQIRAHMADFGHPILGDPKYGDPVFNKSFGRIQPACQLLHAARIEFPVMEPPFSALSEGVVKAPLPTMFQEVLATWQHGIPEV